MLISKSLFCIPLLKAIESKDMQLQVFFGTFKSNFSKDVLVCKFNSVVYHFYLHTIIILKLKNNEIIFNKINFFLLLILYKSNNKSKREL